VTPAASIDPATGAMIVSEPIAHDGHPVSDAVFKICSLDCMATLDVIQFLL